MGRNREDESEAGWATVTLRRALRRATVLPALMMHLMMAGVLVASDVHAGSAQVALVAGHLAAIAVGGAMLATQRLPAVWFVAASYLLVVGNWWYAPVGEAVIAFATIWFHNLVVAAAAFLLPGRWSMVVPITMGAIIGAEVAWRHPELLDTGTPVAQVVTPLVMTLIIVRAARYLRGFAAAADARTAAASAARRAAEVLRISSREAAETARTLHDTVINTLGAIANGGAGVRDVGQVRRRCAADVETVEGVLNGTGATPVLTPDLAWQDLEELTGVAIRRDPDGGEGVRHLAALPAAASTSIARALREVLQNVAAHAGVAEARVRLAVEGDRLVVEVRDEGRGFDVASAHGHGLRESVVARCAEAGVHAEVESAPGRGTTVRLVHVGAEPESPGEVEDFDEVVAQTQARSCWLWASGVVVVGVVIEAVNLFGQWTLTWAMLAVAAGLVGLARLASRGGRPMAWPVQGVLVVGTPVVFVLGLAGTGFTEGDHALHWQTLGVTAPLVVCLYLARPWAVLAAGAGAVVAAAGSWWWVAASGAPFAGMVPVGALAPAAVVFALYVFRDAIARIGAGAARSQTLEQAAAREVAARTAADAARERWRVAGLASSLGLLRRVAQRQAEPSEAPLQQACAAEERHLRQLLTLSPDLVNLGTHLFAAFARSRERGVELTLRAGDLDAPDVGSAAYLGGVVEAAIRAVPRWGALTVGIFARPAGGMVTVVGPTSALERLEVPTPPRGWSCDRAVHGAQTVIALAWVDGDGPASGMRVPALAGV